MAHMGKCEAALELLGKMVTNILDALRVSDTVRIGRY